MKHLKKAIQEICKFTPSKKELEIIIDAYKKDLTEKKVKTIYDFLNEKKDKKEISNRLYNLLTYNQFSTMRLFDLYAPCEDLLNINQQKFMQQRQAGINTWFQFVRLVKELK